MDNDIVRVIFMEMEAISLLNKEIRRINKKIKSRLDAILEAIPDPKSNPQPEPEPKSDPQLRIEHEPESSWMIPSSTSSCRQHVRQNVTKVGIAVKGVNKPAS